ncbi:MAG TPA: T9SS type A sorting domain-containing protein [Candidatus Kapabacteria bacterium]|jgi:hypothetical protein|nr:T9SS type A sorting domain-containing protein [Candidatus Kapabacteria bacterium]
MQFRLPNWLVHRHERSCKHERSCVFAIFSAVLTCIAGGALAPEFSYATLTTGNKFVTAKVEDGSGVLTIVTTNGGYYGNENLLTFRQTSYLTVRLQGQYWTNNDQIANNPAANWNSTNPQYGGMLSNGTATRTGDTIQTVWKVPTGEIIQDVYPVEYDYSGQIVMRWKYHCLVYNVIGAQMQYLLDTYVAGNDEARILTRYGYRNQWTLYNAGGNITYDPIPTFFQAFQHDLSAQYNYNPGVVSQGTFIDQTLRLMKPDAVLVGDWTLLSYQLWGWPYSIPSGAYGDSAILMEFDPEYATAGQTVEIGSTAYGTGEFETCTGDLYALIFRPRTIKADATGTAYSPNPFTVDMYLFNTNLYTQADYTKATLTVGKHLTILDSGATNNNTTQTQWATPRTDGVGSVSVCEWHVYAEKTCDLDTSSLQFLASCNLADTAFNAPCILPVVLPCLDKDTLPPLSYPIVTNGFVKQISFDDNRPKDRGVDTVATFGFNPQYFRVTVDPFVQCTHDKVWVTITQLDSTVGGCVTVRVTDCAGNATTEEVCFPKYPLHPDTIPPHIDLLRSEITYDGSQCNMKYDSLIAVDDTTYDLGLKTIGITPNTTPVNMALNVQSFPPGSASQGFTVTVLDSMIDGSISIRATDRAGNFTDYSLHYCTFPDTNPPRMTVVQTGPYQWSVYVEDIKPYDRHIDTISVYNRQNVQLIRNNAVFEPTRMLTRDLPSFAFEIEVIDTTQNASFCVRAKDLADSTSANLNSAHWWTSDTCLSFKPGEDVWAPNIQLDPSPLLGRTSDTLRVNDIHYLSPTFKIGWDKGIDKIWFSPVDGYLVDGYNVTDTIFENCAMTTPPVLIRVADSTAIKTISTICIHTMDCAGNESDTCIYYPIKPDTLAPFIYGQQPSKTQIDLMTTDSNLYDRGLHHIVLENSVNFSGFEKFVNGDRLLLAQLMTVNPDQSAVGHLSATDLWGFAFGDTVQHTTGIDVALWVQDLAMQVHSLATQNADFTVPVTFVPNDTFALASKNITKFSYSFDLVGSADFQYIGINTTGTASSGWNVNGFEAGNRVTVTGVSTNGAPLVRQDLPLVNIILHAGPDQSTHSVTLVPAIANNESVVYNDDKTVQITEGSHATAILPAPTGSISGATVIIQGSCTPIAETGGSLPTVADLNNASPNPFHGTTELSYTVPSTAFTKLIIYNALGEEVARLVNSEMAQGYYSVVFNAAGLPDGTYFARFECAGQIVTRRLTLQNAQ